MRNLYLLSVGTRATHTTHTTVASEWCFVNVRQEVCPAQFGCIVSCYMILRNLCCELWGEQRQRLNCDKTHLSPSIMSTLEASTPSANQPVCSLDSFRPHTPYWSALKMVWATTVIIKTSQLIPNKRIAAVFARFCQNVPFITHWFPHRCTRYSGLWVFWRQAPPRFSRHSQRERVHVRPQRPQRTIVCCLRWTALNFWLSDWIVILYITAKCWMAHSSNAVPFCCVNLHFSTSHAESPPPPPLAPPSVSLKCLRRTILYIYIRIAVRRCVFIYDFKRCT